MSNPIPNIKRFILRSLKAANGLAVQQSQIEDWTRDRMTPKPLLSDVHAALDELQKAVWIIGTKDKFDETETLWKLTSDGEIEAKQL